MVLLDAETKVLCKEIVRCGAPADGEWFATVKKYENEVLSKRG
jgi:L-rhamnose isomerase